MAAETSEKLFHSFIIKAALETAREQCPDRTFDQETIKDIQKKAELTVNELSQILHKMRKEGMTGVDAVSHLTPERVTKIKKALDNKTFVINIDEFKNNFQITRNGRAMYHVKTLRCRWNEANDLQLASIVVEAIILVLEIIGIEIPDNEDIIQNSIQIVIEELGKNVKLLQDIEQIRKDKDDFPAMAKYIFVLVMDCVHDNIFWLIVKALLSNMSWYEWVLTSAKIAAFIAMLVFTGGIADIALLVANLAKGAVFIEKIKNLVTISKLMTIDHKFNDVLRCIKHWQVGAT